MLQDAIRNESKQAKNIDPVWKPLRITRILYSLWLITLLIFLFFMVKDQGLRASLSFIIFPLLYGIVPIVTQFLQERYWNTIAQRRAQALYHPEALLSSVLSRPTSNESELQLPLHIQLRQGGRTRLLLIVFLCIMVIIGVVFGLIASGSNRPFHFGPLLIVLGSTIGGVLILFVLTLFIQARYFVQTFDITEEGITTRYKFQRRSIRWDEVRLFARYTPQGWNAAASGNIYELTGEQTLVRWAQRPSFDVTMKSNRPEYDDVNWLMGQITTLAMARSSKPLLNLDSHHPSKQRSTGMQAAEMATLQNVPPLGQDDPIISKIKAGNSKKAPLFLGAFGIGIILIGVLLQYSSHDKSLFTGSLIFRYGILVLLFALPAWLIIPATQRYWFNIQRRRQSAVQHPEHGLAAPQPGPTQEQPQPTRLYISMVTNSTSRAFKQFGLLFIIFLAVIELLVFSLNPWYQLAILIGTLLLVGVSVLFGNLARNKSTMQRIDVNANGIASHYILNDTQINWQDARLFATYKSFKPLNIGAPPIQIYELVGEQAVVRWSRQSVTIRTITTEPAMSVEEYERWLQQLHGYISERTQLPLHDLDKVEVPSIR